jgi:hypothetical protein
MARIKQVVERQMTQLGLEELRLDPSTVDWERFMIDAAHRRPPFEPGEKEKGFRDAIILECFLQRIENSRWPTPPRIVLVTGDKLLRTAAEARARQYA